MTDLDNNILDFIKINNYTESDIKTKTENIILGIDLGTTNSCIGIWRNNNLEIIPDENGNKTIPSYVAYTPISRYIGHDAKNQIDINPKNVYYEVKRLIGRKFSDEYVQKNRELMTYDIASSNLFEQNNDNIILSSTINNDNIILLSTINNNYYTPEEISANILTKLKQMAINYLNLDNTNNIKVVITVPAYFSDAQRQATKDASEIAGLNCIRMINEPTAAALAYGMIDRALNNKSDSLENSIKIMVYDFGGGTLDVSILEITNELNEDNKENEDNKYRQIFQVLASAGNTHFGGADFDKRLMSFCITKFKKTKNITTLGDISTISIQKLRTSCETAKKILSTNNATYIAVKNFYQDIDLCIQITRENLEIICGDLLLLSMKNIDEVLETCNLKINDIDEVIVVGGMTRMPAIRNRIEMKFGKKPNCSINPDEAITAGAAIQAHLLNFNNQNNPFSKSVTLLDIIPLSIGVETNGGIMDILINKGTVIPYEVKKSYSTDTDNETSVLIKIYEGERSMTRDNLFIGEFELINIQEALRGVPEIEVTINVDSNSIISVTAEELESHSKKSIIVNSNKGRLTREQIDIMIQEAKDLEMRDHIEKTKKLLFYDIDDMCKNVIYNINLDDATISDKNKKDIEESINEINVWLREKRYYERSDEEILTIKENIKSKFGVLILRANFNKDFETVNNIEQTKTQLNSSTIFGNSEDELDSKFVNNLFEKIEEGELGIFGLTDIDKTEIKELRKNLFSLCYSIFDILSDSKLNISDKHKTELKEYINDTLLWYHIHDKPTLIDYKDKIDQVNDTCNKIFKSYENNLFNNDLEKYDEILENILLSLDILITNNMIVNIDNNLINIINTELDWIIKNNMLKVSNMLEIDNNEYLVMCKNKIDYINKLCSEFRYKEDNLNNNYSKEGTNIIDILKLKQEIEINKLIDENN